MRYPYEVTRERFGPHEYWIAKSQAQQGLIGQGDTLKEALDELESNEQAWLKHAKAIGIPIPQASGACDIVGSLIPNAELVAQLQDASIFCSDCSCYGEPNGCNRKGGYCKAWELAQEAADYMSDMVIEREALSKKELRELPNKTWVWVEVIDDAAFTHPQQETGWYRSVSGETTEDTFACGYPGMTFGFDFKEIGRTWKASKK